MTKKYKLSYMSGATHYGWTVEADRIDEIEDFIKETRREKSANLTLWDNELHDFILWKDCGTFEPRIDKLADCLRDLRTTTRLMK